MYSLDSHTIPHYFEGNKKQGEILSNDEPILPHLLKSKLKEKTLQTWNDLHYHHRQEIEKTYQHTYSTIEHYSFYCPTLNFIVGLFYFPDEIFDMLVIFLQGNLHLMRPTVSF